MMMRTKTLNDLFLARVVFRDYDENSTRQETGGVKGKGEKRTRLRRCARMIRETMKREASSPESKLQLRESGVCCWGLD